MESTKAVLPYYKLDPSEMGTMLSREDLQLFHYELPNPRVNFVRIKGAFCAVEFDKREHVPSRRGSVMLRSYLVNKDKGLLQYPSGIRVTVFSRHDYKLLMAHLPEEFTVIRVTPKPIGYNHKFKGLVNLVFRADLKYPVTTLDNAIDYGLVLVSREAPLRHSKIGVNPFLINTGKKMHPVTLAKQFDVPARLFPRGTLVIRVTEEMVKKPLVVVDVEDSDPIVITTTKELLTPCKFKGWVRKLIMRAEITKCICINGEQLDPFDLTCFTGEPDVPKILRGFGMRRLPLIARIGNGSRKEFEDGYYLRRTVSGHWSLVKLVKNWN